MTRRNIVIYLSGKFSAPTEQERGFNVVLARGTAAMLWNLGFTVICPHSNAPLPKDGCFIHYADYLNGDIELLKRSDCLFMLPEWEKSSGARREHEYAILTKIPVFYKMDDLNDWAKKLLEGKDDPYE